MKIATPTLLVLVFVVTSTLADRDAKLQEDYYLQQLRKHKDGITASLAAGAKPAPNDIVPHNPYGEEDSSLPKVFVFTSLLATWLIVLWIFQLSAPSAVRLLSRLCRQVSEYSRSLSERMARIHEKNYQRSKVSRGEKGGRTSAKSSPRRKNRQPRPAGQRTKPTAEDEQSISPSVLEIIDAAVNEDDLSVESGGRSIFSTSIFFFSRGTSRAEAKSKAVKQQSRQPSVKQRTSRMHNDGGAYVGSTVQFAGDTKRCDGNTDRLTESPILLSKKRGPASKSIHHENHSDPYSTK